jgi:hypothetical protein
MLAVTLAPCDQYPGDGQDPMPVGKGRQLIGRLFGSIPTVRPGQRTSSASSRSSAMPATPGSTSAEGPPQELTKQ